MFPTPKKTIAKIAEGCRGRLSEPVQAVGVFMPRSALVPGQSDREVKHLSKQPVAVAVTPTRLHVFPYKVGAYSGSVKLGDELASWPRAGVEVLRGDGVQRVHAGVSGTVESFNINLKQNLIGLKFPDGQSVVFAYTPMGGTIRELEESFVSELTRGSAQPSAPSAPDAPAGPATFSP
jgi:hypothetical protein